MQRFLTKAQKIKRPVILLEGTRKVTIQDSQRLHSLAFFLADAMPGAIFRSGNAQGADSLFFNGLAETAPERMEYILPYPGSGKKRIRTGAKVFSLADIKPEELAQVVKVTLVASPDLQNLVRAFMDRGRNNVTTKAMYLLRDALKVTGAPSLNLTPADFGFFFTNPENPLAGGTGHTIRVCQKMKVPVFTQDDWVNWAGEMEKR